MASRAKRGGYSRVQVVLHWGTVGLVALQFTVNEDVRQGFRERVWGLEGEALPGVGVHLAGGLLILGLTLIRLAIRLAHGAPPRPEGVPPVLNLLASLAHWALYALLLLMPLAGAIAWFGRIEAAAVLHETGRLVLLAVIMAHVMGGLVEHFVIGNRAIRRML